MAEQRYGYSLNNQSSDKCSICDGFNTAYNSTNSYFNYSIPTDIGLGEISKTGVSKGIRFLDFNLNFHKPIEIQGVSKTPHLDMLFCLENSLYWKLPKAGREFELFPGESYFGISCETTKDTVYPEQCDIRFLEIKIPIAEIQDTLSEIQNSCNRYCHSANVIPFGKFTVTPSIQVIINQLLQCPYQGSLKQLYIEGKLLELLAVYFNEVIYQTHRIPEKLNLSAQDIQCIYRAKNILDNNITETPTLQRLSRLVGINEFKLKKGFKELFDTPIHTYVINQRLELAKALLDERTSSISNVAIRTGYGNMSHFAAAFRSKFGVNPGEYLRNISK